MENENGALVQEQATQVTDNGSAPAEAGGHKVLFYVMIGLLAISIVGVPILAWRLSVRKKQLKQVEAELAKFKASQVIQPVEQPAAPVVTEQAPASAPAQEPPVNTENK